MRKRYRSTLNLKPLTLYLFRASRSLRARAPALPVLACRFPPTRFGQANADLLTSISDASMMVLALGR